MVALGAVSVLYSLASGPQTSTFNSGDIDVSQIRRLALNISVTAVSGTTPSMTVTVERKTEAGVYIAIFTGTAITAAGTQIASIGPGLVTQHMPGHVVRVNFTISGTTPSFTMSADLTGF